jgi:isopenicillin N synthase-like dioxygenase
MYVQTVDFKSLHASENFVDSLRSTGFAVVKNHPVSPDLICDTFREWEKFFAGTEKHAYTFDPCVQAGYFPLKSENAKGYTVKDLKEFYHYYTWHGLPNSLSQNTVRLYEILEEIACTFLGWIEENAPQDLRETFCMSLPDMVRHSRNSLLRILHYPPLTENEEEGAIRAHAHEDINLITVFPAASTSGLQVRDLVGEWHDVQCEPGEVVINAGDMLQMLTRRYYISTTHRVINPLGSEARRSRYAMPLFLHAHSHVRISETHTQESYLNERLNEIGLLPADQMPIK